MLPLQLIFFPSWVNNLNQALLWLRPALIQCIDHSRKILHEPCDLESCSLTLGVETELYNAFIFSLVIFILCIFFWRCPAYVLNHSSSFDSNYRLDECTYVDVRNMLPLFADWKKSTNIRTYNIPDSVCFFSFPLKWDSSLPFAFAVEVYDANYTHMINIEHSQLVCYSFCTLVRRASESGRIARFKHPIRHAHQSNISNMYNIHIHAQIGIHAATTQTDIWLVLSYNIEQSLSWPCHNETDKHLTKRHLCTQLVNIGRVLCVFCTHQRRLFVSEIHLFRSFCWIFFYHRIQCVSKRIWMLACKWLRKHISCVYCDIFLLFHKFSRVIFQENPSVSWGFISNKSFGQAGTLTNVSGFLWRSHFCYSLVAKSIVRMIREQNVWTTAK